MLKIRLRRMGSTHRPFYRVVVSDSRNVPTGKAVDEIGFYNPIVTPKVIEIDRTRLEHWVTRGAQVTPTVAQLVKRAGKPQPAPVVAAAPAEPPPAVVTPPAEPTPAVETPPAETPAAEAATTEEVAGA